MSVEVIIPVKDRSEIFQCVESLLSLEQISRIWVCDGGSVESGCVKALQAIVHDERIQYLKLPMAGFNKAYLLNQGILQTTAEYILISDADIVWNSESIQALLQAVFDHRELICTIGEVKEFDPVSVSLQREQYTYQIVSSSDTVRIEILPINLPSSTVRPGCGLILTRKEVLLKLGGYQECFEGWGWEDQDLLIRASLLGIQLQMAGSVVHISHGDDRRNQHFHNISPSETRNYNIRRCLTKLVNGNLMGDLPLALVPQFEHRKIQIQIPDFLSH